MSDQPTSQDPTSSNASAEPLPPLTWRRKLLFSAILVFALVAGTEALVRVGFFLGDNFSPYYLTFGFVPDIENHSAEHEGYSTFQPSRVYHFKSERGHTIDMHINSSGFRYPTDFVKPKPPGTFRIVALGESSTFGLANDDANTYPAILEELLKSRMPGRPVEVINMGIPHWRSNHILAAARAELPSLNPDIVTLYAGYNNSMALGSSVKPGVLYRLKDWMKAHSVTYRALHPYVAVAYQKIATRMKVDVSGAPNLSLPLEMPASRVAAMRAAALEEYRRDLDSIAAVVERAGGRLVLMTQTFTFARLPTVRLAGPTRRYGAEVAFVDSLLTANGSIPAPYASALIHKDITDLFRSTAQRNGLTLVDGIATLDTGRDTIMASFVHLNNAGTRRLAVGIESTFVAQGVIPGPLSGPAPPAPDVARNPNAARSPRLPARRA